jgi:uncharacterized protein YecE (DUF72 family)
VFAWKASKFITHWKRLRDSSRNSLALIEERLAILGKKSGPVLFQLPPQFKADGERLASFIKLLPHQRRYVFEFRDKSWYTDSVMTLLSKNDIALCLSDHHDAPAPWETTARHVYIRGHGPSGAYTGHYSARTLQRWARQCKMWRAKGRMVYVYFDNDQKSAAPVDALRLARMVGAA